METFTLETLHEAVVEAVNGEVDDEYPQEMTGGGRRVISSDSKIQADKDVQNRVDQKATVFLYQLLHLNV